MKKGVYCIKNNVNNKIYIGSTNLSFSKRLSFHKWQLRNNKHKNSHLQYTWNKYGESNFSFEILEELTDNILEKEQEWINKYDFENLYNINPLATGGNQFPEEIIEKRRQTMLRKYASGEFDYIKEIQRNHIPWNKGKKYVSTNHLKVPKKIRADKSKSIETKRNDLSRVAIYDVNNNLLGIWRSAKDLEEWSLTDENTLPINSRFSTERMNKPVKFLQSCNINKACKNNTLYKGLYFKFL